MAKNPNKPESAASTTEPERTRLERTGIAAARGAIPGLVQGNVKQAATGAAFAAAQQAAMFLPPPYSLIATGSLYLTNALFGARSKENRQRKEDIQRLQDLTNQERTSNTGLVIPRSFGEVVVPGVIVFPGTGQNDLNLGRVTKQERQIGFMDSLGEIGDGDKQGGTPTARAGYGDEDIVFVMDQLAFHRGKIHQVNQLLFNDEPIVNRAAGRPDSEAPYYGDVVAEWNQPGEASELATEFVKRDFAVPRGGGKVFNRSADLNPNIPNRSGQRSAASIGRNEAKVTIIINLRDDGKNIDITSPPRYQVAHSATPTNRINADNSLADEAYVDANGVRWGMSLSQVVLWFFTASIEDGGCGVPIEAVNLELWRTMAQDRCVVAFGTQADAATRAMPEIINPDSEKGAYAFHQGRGDPAAGLGDDKDVYWNRANNEIWRKTAGAWAQVADLDDIPGSHGEALTSLGFGRVSDGTARNDDNTDYTSQDINHTTSIAMLRPDSRQTYLDAMLFGSLGSVIAQDEDGRFYLAIPPHVDPGEPDLTLRDEDLVEGTGFVTDMPNPTTACRVTFNSLNRTGAKEGTVYPVKGGSDEKALNTKYGAREEQFYLPTIVTRAEAFSWARTYVALSLRHKYEFVIHHDRHDLLVGKDYYLESRMQFIPRRRIYILEKTPIGRLAYRYKAILYNPNDYAPYAADRDGIIPDANALRRIKPDAPTAQFLTDPRSVRVQWKPIPGYPKIRLLRAVDDGDFEELGEFSNRIRSRRWTDIPPNAAVWKFKIQGVRSPTSETLESDETEVIIRSDIPKADEVWWILTDDRDTAPPAPADPVVRTTDRVEPASEAFQTPANVTPLSRLDSNHRALWVTSRIWDREAAEWGDFADWEFVERFLETRDGKPGRPGFGATLRMAERALTLDTVDERQEWWIGPRQPGTMEAFADITRFALSNLQTRAAVPVIDRRVFLQEILEMGLDTVTLLWRQGENARWVEYVLDARSSTTDAYTEFAVEYLEGSWPDDDNSVPPANQQMTLVFSRLNNPLRFINLELFTSSNEASPGDAVLDAETGALTGFSDKWTEDRNTIRIRSAMFSAKAVVATRLETGKVPVPAVLWQARTRVREALLSDEPFKLF